MRVTGVSPKLGSAIQVWYRATLFPGAAPGSPRLFDQTHNPYPWRICLQALEHCPGCRPAGCLCQGTKPQSRAEPSWVASPSFGGNIPWGVSIANLHAAFLGEPGEIMPSSSALKTKASPCVFSPGHLWAPLSVDCQENQCCDLHSPSPGSPKCAEVHRSSGHIRL